MRPKLITSTDHNIHVLKQEALVSSQQGILPKLITSEGTQLPKLPVHQITKKSSTRSEVYSKSLQSKCKQKLSISLRQEILVHPWTKLVTDIFHLEGASYLLIVDYRSRFPIVCKLSSVTGVHVANQCKLILSEYGWPETLISDNGPCYTSQAFTGVMKSYNVNHIISSPHDLQSNGLTEKYVQIVKGLFYKAKEGTDFYKCLMSYHSVLPTGSMQSPMQILQSRNARSDLPMSNAARKQLGIQPEVVRNTDKYAALPTHDLHVGQQVIFMILQASIGTQKLLRVCVLAQSNHIWPVKTGQKKKSQVKNQMQVQTSRPKRDTKPPVKLDL